VDPSALILGMDAFIPYIPPYKDARHCTYSVISRLVKRCISMGFRRFDFSLYEPLMAVLRDAKRDYGDELVLVGNPSWRCGVQIGDTELFDLRDRVLATLHQLCPKLADALKSAPIPAVRSEWWSVVDTTAKPLQPFEIDSIKLDRKRIRTHLAAAAELATSLILGADYADWLVLLGRADILAEMYGIASEYLPVYSIAHFSEWVLPTLDACSVSGHFIPFGRNTVFFEHHRVAQAAKNCKKPIVATFSLLRGCRTGDQVCDLLAFPLAWFPTAQCLVGVATERDAESLAEVQLVLNK